MQADYTLGFNLRQLCLLLCYAHKSQHLRTRKLVKGNFQFRMILFLFIVLLVLFCKHTCESAHMESSFRLSKLDYGINSIWNLPYIDYFKGLQVSHKRHGKISEMSIRRSMGHWHQIFCHSHSEIDSATLHQNEPLKGHGPKRLKRKEIFIVGLFELTGRRQSSGTSELTAAKLAVAHVNAKNFLPGYRLTLLYNNTEVSVIKSLVPLSFQIAISE